MKNKHKKLLNLETILGIISMSIFLILTTIGAFFSNGKVWFTLLFTYIGMAQLLIFCFFANKIEQIAGFYVCKNCEYKYVPSYRSALFAPHLGRTKYLKCPKCKTISWQNKVVE